MPDAPEVAPVDPAAPVAPVDAVAEIDALIAAGDDRAAFDRLRASFGWPAGKAAPAADLPRWLGLLGELAGRRDALGLAQLAGEAVHDPDSPDRLYDLGFALIDAGAPELAASVLWRCLALVGESEEVVCELVSALESALAYADAVAVLGAHPGLREKSFLCRYLYAFDAAMAGRLDLTRQAVPQLAPEAPEHVAMAERLEALVARAARLHGPRGAPDPADLRGWHYVLTGGLLLHQSPYGFDDVMHGRYAWLGDSLPRIASGLDRLVAMLRERGPLPPCVYAPPGKNHEIIARALSVLLDRPLAPWPAIGVPAPGLVALYDLAELDPADASRLVQRRPDQVLFAHASPWTWDSHVAPDATTLLYQTLVAPWGEQLVVNPDTKEVTPRAPDPRDAEAIAAELVASPRLDAEDLSADEPARWAALVARTWPLDPGPRSRLWAGGPVPSSRFT